jgi:hypothetical protein
MSHTLPRAPSSSSSSSSSSSLLTEILLQQILCLNVPAELEVFRP